MAQVRSLLGFRSFFFSSSHFVVVAVVFIGQRLLQKFCRVAIQQAQGEVAGAFTETSLKTKL
jgi:hypothetical protein